MKFSRAGISRCPKCPLRDRRRVWGEFPDDGQVRQLFLGEAPGEQENLKGHCFVGPSGGLLNSGLSQAGVERFRQAVSNVISCQPTGNRLDTVEGEEAISCCQPGLKAELAELERRGLRVITPLGNVPMRALGLETSIGKARGSVYELKDFGRGKVIAIPAYHPSWLLRGNQKEIPTWVADLAKAKDLSSREYKPPREDFNLFPSLADVKKFCHEAISKKAIIGIDIETVGIRADRAALVVIGLAMNAERAISVPFLCQGGTHYWKGENEIEVREEISTLLSTVPGLYQNALFDVLHLRERGFHVAPPEHDILLAHHAIHPELPHTLEYIVSIYGKTPYWKDTLKLRDNSILQIPDDELRTYNLRDAVVLHQTLQPLLKDLDITKTRHIYEGFSMPLVEVLSRMTARGISINRKALLAWGRSLARKKRKLDLEIRELAGLHQDFNLESGDHKRLLIYGVRASQFTKALAKMEDYDDPLRKKSLRRDTKVFRELRATLEVLESTHPLWSGPRARQTKGGRLSVDDESLLSLQIAALTRGELIGKFINPTKDHLAEGWLIDKTLSFLEKFSTYQSVSKLLSTYTDFPTWKDGRVHTSFMIHRTDTGRLASKDPNLQNIPRPGEGDGGEARKVFVSRSGMTFTEADYSNLEPRLLAYVSGDVESIKIFESGGNIHDANTIALFPWITKSDPLWKDARYAAKKYRLAMNYGGSLYGIYRKVCLEVPKLKLTFSQFKQANENYQGLHIGETRWLEKIKKEVVKTRELRNIFGRIRIFLGTEAEIEREGVNFPIQSSAADIIGQAMIAIHRDFEALGGENRPRLLLQVHDSLLVEHKPSDRAMVMKILRKHMEKPVTIKGIARRLPVEFATGSSWGMMKDVG